jgi:hypothetical protein
VDSLLPAHAYFMNCVRRTCKYQRLKIRLVLFNKVSAFRVAGGQQVIVGGFLTINLSFKMLNSGDHEVFLI